MKGLPIFAILILIVMSMASCGKDPKPDDPINPIVNSITFGDYEGMEVVTFDSIDWEYYEAPYLISYEGGGCILDEDVYCSFGLMSSVTISDNLTLDRCEITICSTHLEFQYETVLNNVYVHIDTTILQTDSIPSIYIDYLETCNKIDESDQFDLSYNLSYPQLHSKNEALSLEDSFAISPTACYCLYYSYGEEPTQVTETSEAVIFEHWVLAPEECYNAPTEEEFYMGFKYSNEGRDRLGWVKLIIEPNPNCIFLVRPLEAAIQK